MEPSIGYTVLNNCIAIGRYEVHKILKLSISGNYEMTEFSSPDLFLCAINNDNYLWSKYIRFAKFYLYMRIQWKVNNTKLHSLRYDNEYDFKPLCRFVI